MTGALVLNAQVLPQMVSAANDKLEQGFGEKPMLLLTDVAG